MEFELVEIDKIKFKNAVRSEESKKLITAIKKIEENKLKGILFSENGMKLDKLAQRVRSNLTYWKREGLIAQQITATITEDKKLALSWSARKRKNRAVVV